MELLERGEALDAFSRALREAAAGRGRVLLVRGEAGIGKTALVRHALDTRADGARVLLATCDDLMTARPLGAFRDLASQVLDDRLADLLRHGASVDELFDPLVDELGRPPRPVILTIEDVHWADEATLDLLAFVLRRLDQVPALVVLTFRSGVEPTHPLRSLLGRVATPQAVHLDLAPLSRGAVARLGEGTDTDLLWQRTRGNPFLVTAMLRHHDDTVPPSVQDAVLAELADLLPPERALVELAAVVPRCVETPVLDACRPGWEEHGTRPELRGLLELRGGVVAFRHELARRAVFEALPAARRRQLHRDVLAVLRQRDEDPARLVHHAIGADDVPTLLDAGPRAARSAASAGAHRQALEHYERLVQHDAGLELSERATLWAEYGSELMTADQPERASAAYEQAAALYREAGDDAGHGRALAYLAGLAWIHHDIEESDRRLDEAIAELEALPQTVELAHAWTRRAGRLMTRWSFEEAERWARRALALAEDLGNDKEQAHARCMLGTSLVTRGEVQEGLLELNTSLAVADRIRSFNLISLGHGNAAEALLDAARPDLARSYVEHGLALAHRHETASVAGFLTGVHARLLAVECEYDAAVRTARTVWGGGPITVVNQIVAGLALARAMLRRGDDTAGLLTALRDLVTRRGEIQYMGPVAALRAEATWLAGVPAPPELLDVLDRARVRGQPWLLGDLATWAWRNGVLVEVTDALPEPYARAVAGDPEGAATAWRARGYRYEALVALAESEEAGTVTAAVEEADRLGAAPLAARLRQRLRELGVRRIPRGPQPATRENPAGLTDRQLEVLQHVTAGRTNAEIAEALVVSVRTVDHHVSAALAKLGVTSRHDAAELAAELGIVPAG